MTSAMVEMSRAIRHVLEDSSQPSGKLGDIPTEKLKEFVQITGAFYYDMKEELERREKA